MKPDKHYNLAMNLIKSKDYDSARRHLRKALSKQPDHRAALHDLAGCLAMLGDLPGSADYYERLLKLDPQCYSALANLGTIYSKLKRWDDALTVCQKAVLLNPTSAIAYSSAANVLGQMGRISEALKCDKRAIELDPDDPGLWSAYCMRALYSADLKPLDVWKIHQEYGRRFGLANLAKLHDPMLWDEK